jgi:hypothetical protein
MSTMYVNNIAPLEGDTLIMSANINMSGHSLDASGGFTPPAGHVIQVVQGELGTTTSATPAGNTSVDIGLQATITPSSTSSKILVQYTVFLGQDQAYNAFTRIVRDSTQIGNGTQEGSRPVGNSVVNTYSANNDGYNLSCASNSYLDSPSTTSSITYKIQIGAYSGNGVFINRSAIYQNTANYDTTPLSTITVMEIAG